MKMKEDLFVLFLPRNDGGWSLETGETPRCLGAVVALAEDLSSRLSTMWKLTTFGNSSSRGHNILFCLPWALHAQAYVQTR